MSLARAGGFERPLVHPVGSVDNGTMREVPDLVAEMRALLTAFADAGVEYALCGGLAANIYGADRFTIDIDLLVAPADLQAALTVATSNYGW